MRPRPDYDVPVDTQAGVERERAKLRLSLARCKARGDDRTLRLLRARLERLHRLEMWIRLQDPNPVQKPQPLRFHRP